MKPDIAVIGGGAWGTILANLLSSKGYQVRLWVYEKELVEIIKETHENTIFLPGIRISDRIVVSNNIDEVIDKVEIIIIAVPSHHFRKVVGYFVPFIRNDITAISATKGIEENTLMRMSEILMQEIKERYLKNVAVLSGPTFAREIASGLPAAAVIGCVCLDTAKKMQTIINTSNFRIYSNNDIIGVESGGALKNVIAIATGISDGLSLGANARAALITRGLTEISRLAIRMGANPVTLSGLAGLGDLVLTCTSSLSRNYTLGFEISSGKSIEEIMSKRRSVAEGVRTSRSAVQLARKNGIEMPISQEVEQILFYGKKPSEALKSLLSRQLRDES